MPEIDRPFEGLDHVWIWRIPHPADPEAPRKWHHVTRIGTLEGGRLVGRVQLSTRPSRTILGPIDELQGIGEWRTAKLGKATLHRSGEPLHVVSADVRSGDVEGSWKPGGHFQVGDQVEVNHIATGGRPYPPTIRELGENALAVGRSLLRRVRGRDEPDPSGELASAPEPEQPEVPATLSAFDGWLVAVEEDVAGQPAWRVAIDRRPGTPESVGVGVVLAAIGLAHPAG